MRRWGWRHMARTAPAGLLLPAPSSLSLLSSLSIPRNHDRAPRDDLFLSSFKGAKGAKGAKGTKETKETKGTKWKKGTRGTKNIKVTKRMMQADDGLVQLMAELVPEFPPSLSSPYHNNPVEAAGPRFTSRLTSQSRSKDNNPVKGTGPGFTSPFTSQPRPREAEYRKFIMPDEPLRTKIRLEVPRLPRGMFRDPESVLGRISSFRVSWTTQLESPKYSCWLTASSQGPPFQTIGHGMNKIDARRAAFQCMIVEFYERGILDLLWGQFDDLEPRVIEEERDAIVHVYDYAARYGYIPVVSQSRTGGRGSRTWMMEISLPEHNIRVTARSKEAAQAEIAAALKFKRAAEEFQLERQSMGDIDAEETSPLSSTTFTSFTAYLKDTATPGVDVYVETSQEAQFYKGAVSVGGQPTGHVLKARNKSMVLTLGGVVGSVVVARQRPELLKAFTDVLEANHGTYLRKATPVDLNLPAEMMTEMHYLNTMVESRLMSQRRGNRESLGGNKATPTRRSTNPTLDAPQRVAKSGFLKQKLDEYEQRPDLQHLRQLRSELPMSQNAPKLLELVENSIYSIVIGATGSGKTTQVPQILLDEAIRKGEGASCNIICTQPRRIAATSIARRVADERAENLQQTVGYHVRFDPRPPRPHGSILYATTGILLAQVQNSPDDILDYASHLVIDEVHDRDVNVDLLLLALKKAMAERAQKGLKIPRVILMSATIEAEFFASYFRNALPPNYQGTVANDCPALSVPGRTFPVEEHYLDHIMSDLEEKHGRIALHQIIDRDKDSRKYVQAEMAEAAQPTPIDWSGKSDTDAQQDALVPLALTAATIAHIAKTTGDDGGILVFLPGLNEILKLSETLQRDRPFGVNFKDQTNFRIFMLHSSIQDNQQSVFDALPPGCRKIILSTNIAETSVTLPDVRYVVDTGKLRQKAFDHRRRITSLQCTWVSKSNAKQRAGRAGRVANGSYYALYTRSRREGMRQTGLPELLRCDLQETCLLIKSHESSMQLPIGELLSQVIEPPPPTAVALAVQNLKSLGAIDMNEAILPLGRVLSSLPVHPSLGKMIVLGIVFRCLSPMIVLGAAVGERNPFHTPLGQKHEARTIRNETFVRNSWSDHMALLTAFEQFAEILVREGTQATHRWCYQNFIRFDTMNSIYSTTKQIEDILVQMGLAKKRTTGSKSDSSTALDPIVNENAGSDGVIRAILAAGLSPNIAQSSRPGWFRTASELNTRLSQDSANQKLPLVRSIDSYLLTFSGLALSNDNTCIFLRETTLISPLMALLFGGRLGSPSHGGLIEVNSWLRLIAKPSDGKTPVRTASRIVVKFAQYLEVMMVSAFQALQDKRSLSDDMLLARVATSLPRLLAWPMPQAARKTRTADSSSEISQGGSSRSPQRQISWSPQRDRYWFPQRGNSQSPQGDDSSRSSQRGSSQSSQRDDSSWSPQRGGSQALQRDDNSQSPQRDGSWSPQRGSSSSKAQSW
ncbi:P-loop containing nucleoside triphosphate hydrolase protein [Nemania serpens]|nr:P-loop containing nucleoside triphosphate hydrolase protein [Nemania serpens]